MLTGELLDWVGAVVGACRLPELEEEPPELEELPELEEPLELEEPPELDEELPDEPEPLEDADRLWVGLADGAGAERLGALVLGALVLAAAWVAPGSRTVTTPAAARLATETAAVAEDRRLRPCSRSATARATADRRVRNCGLLMSERVPCQLVRAVCHA